MEAIFDIFQQYSWIISAGIFAGGFFMARSKIKGVLKLVGLLIDAIEIIDKDIHDVLSEEQIKKIQQIKRWVNRKAGVKEKAILDKELSKKQILGKKYNGAPERKNIR